MFHKSNLILSEFAWCDRLYNLSNELVQLVNLECYGGFSDEVTPSMYRVLGILYYNGNTTVPNAAKVMGTGRQYIQRVVNDLLKLGLVTRRHNVRHKRSWLIGLTTHGNSQMKEFERKGHDIIKKLSCGIVQSDINQCMTTLLNIINNIKIENNWQTSTVNETTEIRQKRLLCNEFNPQGELKSRVKPLNSTLLNKEKQILMWNAGLGLKIKAD